jgi:hypothetical protein
LAPFGLSDAFAGILRPTPSVPAGDRRFDQFLDRKIAAWRARWPDLKIVRSDSNCGHAPAA